MRIYGNPKVVSAVPNFKKANSPPGPEISRYAKHDVSMYVKLSTRRFCVVNFPDHA